MADIPADQLDDFCRQMGVAVRRDGASRAGSKAKVRSGHRRRPGRKAAGGHAVASSQSGTVRDSLAVNEIALGLELALVRFPGSGSRQSQLLANLKQAEGVRQIFETAHSRDVHAVVVFKGPRKRLELRARLEEFAHELFWDDVLFETSEPASATWQALTRDEARDEGLLE
jgi:hypothetical protein